MARLTKENFYFGAILTAILEYNPETSIVLLQPDEESRRIYKIETNESQECVIFFKYATNKSNSVSKLNDTNSWVYQFSDKEKMYLKKCHDNKTPVFIYLLCSFDSLKNSEIAVLQYDEFKDVSEKQSITISLNKHSRNFCLHRSKSRQDVINIPKKRIEKSFNDLIKEVVDMSNGYYCPKCGNIIHL